MLVVGTLSDLGNLNPVVYETAADAFIISNIAPRYNAIAVLAALGGLLLYFGGELLVTGGSRLGLGSLLGRLFGCLRHVDSFFLLPQVLDALLSRNGLLRAFPRTRVCFRPLTMHREMATMAQTTVATNLR